MVIEYQVSNKSRKSNFKYYHFFFFYKQFSCQTQTMQNACITWMVYAEIQQNYRNHCTLLHFNHSNRQSYWIHAYPPKLNRPIDITNSDFSNNFKNFQTNFSKTTCLEKRRRKEKSDPNRFSSRNVTSGSLTPTFLEFQFIYINNEY